MTHWNSLEQLMLRPGDGPWNVHVEAELTQRADIDALATAIRETLALVPRLWPDGQRDTAAGFKVSTVSSDAASVDTRAAFLSVDPAVDAPAGASLALFLLLRGAMSDSLVLNLHHAAGDGVAAFALVRAEVVPSLVGVEVAVPHLRPAGW